jgi:ATP-binding cassette subfamily B protein
VSDRARGALAGWLRWVDGLTARTPAPVALGAHFRRQLPLFAAGVVMLAVQQWMMAERDLLAKAAVDALGAGRANAAATSALFILVVSAVAAVTRLCSRATMFTGGRNVEYELRGLLLARIHALGPSFFRRMPTGEIMSRATSDLQQVRLLMGFGVLNVVSSILALASALYVMLSISVRLTLAALATFPALLLVTRSFSVRLFARNRDNQRAIGEMSDRVLASLAGVRVVKSFAMEASELGAFDAHNRSYLDAGLALARLRGSMGPVMGAVSAAGVLVTFWYGGTLLAGDPRFTPGDFVAFWLALLRLTWPMLAIGFVAAIVQRGRAGYARLREIYDAEPDVRDGPRPPPARVGGEIDVRSLSFSYRPEGPPALDGVSLRVPAGGSLAIVGRTGSGKSTLAALLPRLVPPPPGSVWLDGVDVCELPLATVRGAIGYAQQDAFLFSTTVADNIAYALAADETLHRAERVREAAAEAQVLDDVERLPHGFDTVVGERGVQLSGGQKQRVALARALVREPTVLVLDDPLSAVDARTEAAILEAIERQKAERTVLLVTHRVAAARRCDRIVVLERGRVVEQGSHEQLVAAGGLYALFAEEQRAREELEALDREEAVA